MVHIIGTLATLVMFLIISAATVSYVASMTQAVISSQLEEVAAEVSSTAVDLTVLAVNSKSESLVLEKTINIPTTVSNSPYSVLLVESGGVWQVMARLNAQPTVSGEAALWSGNSPTINMVQSTVSSGEPLIVRCQKTTVGDSPSLTIQLFGG
jgi:hypothetical protein